MIYRKKKLALLIALLMIISIAVPVSAAKVSVSGERYITSENGKPVNVRSKPDINSNLAPVGRFTVGTKVTLKYRDTDNKGNIWYDVRNSSNRGGWVRSDFLTENNPNPLPTPTTPPTTGVIGNGVNSTVFVENIRNHTGIWQLDTRTYHPQIVQLQEMLREYNNQYWNFDEFRTFFPNGIYDSNTQSLVRYYQMLSNHGLAVDGCVGYYTLSCLEQDIGRIIH